MNKEDLIKLIESALNAHVQIASFSRIDGEDAIGVETSAGDEYFITIQEA